MSLEAAKVERMEAGKLLALIRPGDRVTIEDRFGKQSSGRASICQAARGVVVLNMGGRYGTPARATAQNLVKVKFMNERSYL